MVHRFALLVVTVTGLVTAGPGLSSAQPRELGPLPFTSATGLTESGQTVLSWARAARFHGLETSRQPSLPSLEAPPQEASTAPSSALASALYEQLVWLLAELPPRPREVAILKDPDVPYYASPDQTWRTAAPPAAAPEAIDQALTAAREGRLAEYLESLLPRHPQYRRLVTAAERYAGLCEAGLPEVPRPPSKRGAPRRAKFKPPTGDYALALEKRLAAEGFLAPELATGTWEQAAQDAFARWLSSRQLPEPRGLLMDDLHRALAIPCDALVDTLTLNVRRWRYSAWRGEATFVEVNIAAQELRYVRDHELAMSQRTIVGATHWYQDKDLDRRFNTRSTPILSHQISRIVINPTWSVPPSIARRVIEKELAKDPAYLEKNRIKAITTARGTTYVQDPGEDNALGVIKILFPNEESIYLHDTPKKNAFKLAVRALSHGCVRVQNALDLGLALLEADAAKSQTPFDASRLRRRAGHGGPIVFDLAATVPVFLEYYTASVDDAGLVRFHPDIYAYDAALAR
ncbi:MAG TPA: L,D-transpeptidase family protein [Myxococcota bacterium]|nr:L,D-transpeptidase family protein [Myxococcota bacterium]